MHLSDLLEDFELYQRAANRSPQTIAWYRAYIGPFERFLIGHGYDTDCEATTTRVIREYVAELQGQHKPITVSNAVRTLNALFNYAVNEGLIDIGPKKSVPRPKVPRTDFAVHDTDEIDRLLQACNQKTLTGSVTRQSCSCCSIQAFEQAN
jgi:site-specific recombinase XerD